MALETALVTGASGGIGLELARVLASRNHPLVVVARQEDRLQALAAELRVPVEVIALDLGQPGSARQLYDEVKRRGLRVEIVINNAGFGHNGPFLEADLDMLTSMMELNMVTLTELCHLFGQELAAGGRGRIMNVASTAAFQPGPWMAVYYATKAYVLSLSEALHEELRPRGVTVTALCPGPTRTGFQDRAELGGARFLKYLTMMEARPVAEQGYQAMMAGRSLHVPGLFNRLMALSVRFAPRFLATRLSGQMARKEH